MDFGPTVILQASSATVANSSDLAARSDLSSTIKSLLCSRDYFVKSGGKPRKMLRSSISRRDRDGARATGSNTGDCNCVQSSKTSNLSNHVGHECQNAGPSDSKSLSRVEQSRRSSNGSENVNSPTILALTSSQTDCAYPTSPFDGCTMHSTVPHDHLLQRSCEDDDTRQNKDLIHGYPPTLPNGTSITSTVIRVASQDKWTDINELQPSVVEAYPDCTSQTWPLPTIKPNQSPTLIQTNRTYSTRSSTVPSPSRAIRGRFARNGINLRPSKRSPQTHGLTNRTAVDNSYELKSRENSLSSEHMDKPANRNVETDQLTRLNNRTGSADTTQVIPDVNGVVEDAITAVNIIRPRLVVSNATNTTTGFASDPRSRTCCFCWCCCCSCSCIRVKHNLRQSKSPSASNDLQSKLEEMESNEKLTLEEVKSWSDSFDLLMQSPGGRKVFREFLRSEYSEENILFWLACEELKKETNPELVEEKARMIYEDFISILSPREVSLDSRVRELINANMIEPTPGTFDEAQLQIYTLMHRDSYLRFLNSKVYKDLLRQTSEDCAITESLTS